MKIQLQGADNARDFRGIVNTDGKKIISKDFIRSNHLHDLSEEDIRILKKEYGLVKIIDLRTKLETEQKPDTKIEGVEHIHIPVFDESAIGITHEADTDMQHRSGGYSGYGTIICQNGGGRLFGKPAF